jgi:hypothetical protein
VFENRALRRTFRSKRDEVKEDDIDRAGSMNGEKRNAYKILVKKTEVKRPLGRPRRR